MITEAADGTANGGTTTCVRAAVAVLLAAALVALASLRAAHGATEASVVADAPEALVELGAPDAARTLQVRGSTDVDVFAPVLEAFLANTPGLRVRYEHWPSNALYRRADAACRGEAEAADLLVSSAVDQLVRLVNDGCAAPHVSPLTQRLATHLNWRDELFGITLEPAVIVYNRDLVAPEEVPLTRFDLIDLLRPFDTRFAGRVATYDIEASGLGYLFAFADAQQASTSGALLEAFGRSGAVATCCSAEITDAVAEGEFLIAYNVLGSYALARADTDPRLGVVAPLDYTLTLARAAMLPRGAPRPEEARALLDYLLSDAGRRALADARLIASLEGDGSLDFPTGTEDSRVLRPIPLSPVLLVGLDRMKRERFVAQWRENMSRPDRASRLP